jgi:hypothetical protein
MRGALHQVSSARPSACAKRTLTRRAYFQTRVSPSPPKSTEHNAPGGAIYQARPGGVRSALSFELLRLFKR